MYKEETVGRKGDRRKVTEPVAEAITMRGEAGPASQSMTAEEGCGGGATGGGAALVEGGSTIIRREMRGA